LHQFTRVGKLVIIQGGWGASKDVPPFTVVRGNNRLCGLNVVGLRRAGYSAADRLELKKLYHALFRSGKNITEAAVEARRNFSSHGAQVMLEFIATAKRGVCADGGKTRGGEEE
jgi:UDP-N-acetylglucosamine acyltransferase